MDREAILAEGPVVVPAKKPVYEFFKRVLDVVISVLSLILLSPLFLFTIILIRLDSKGRAIYVSDRVTKDGKVFKMYKFRTMREDAEEHLEKLQEHNEIKDGPAFKMKDDPRITRVGRFLRKSSIDELPQLVNIIHGEMSIVGPRPPLPREVAQYTPYQYQRLGVVQGLTCFWQCSGRNDIGFKDWVELDLKYIRERGFWTDTKIFFRTFGAVFTMKGAK